MVSRCLLGDGRQVDQAHALVGVEATAHHVRPAIHRHVMPTRRQSLPEVLDQGLEPTVGGRHAAGAEERDLHSHLPPSCDRPEP